MKAKNYVILALLVSVSFISLNAQVYVDGVTGKVGVGAGFDVTPPENALDVNGDVNIMNGKLLKDGEQVIFSTYNSTDGNVALNTAIVASSTLDPHVAGNAVDDDLVSYWSNEIASNDEDLTITLTTESVISDLHITSGAGSDFGTYIKISYSLNNTDWYTDPAMEKTSGTVMTDELLTFSAVNAKFVKIEMHNDVASAFTVSNITITGKEAIPEAAIWRKQRDADENYTDDIIYDKGDVTIGADLTLKGWDDNLLTWVPKTMQLNWRGSLLFSRFLIQEPMVEGTVWNRGLISQNLKWNETTNVYDIMGGGANYPDFAAMIFENRGDIGFFTHDQSPLADNLTKEELEAYRRMTITKEGGVKIPMNIMIGDQILTESIIEDLKSGNNLWSQNPLEPSNIATNKYVGIGTIDLEPGSWLTVGGKITTENIDVTRDIYQNGNLLDLTGATSWEDNSGNLFTSKNIGIGTAPCSNITLNVNGIIMAKQVVVVDPVPQCDYVFDENYELMTIAEVDSFISVNNHLPDVPSAENFKNNGYSVADMDAILLKKIEELTLYVIELKKENVILKKALEARQ